LKGRFSSGTGNRRSRLISGARLLILSGGHGDYLGEAVVTPRETRYPELTARLITTLEHRVLVRSLVNRDVRQRPSPSEGGSAAYIRLAPHLHVSHRWIIYACRLLRRLASQFEGHVNTPGTERGFQPRRVVDTSDVRVAINMPLWTARLWLA
jgi:hypothetical protein